MTSPFNYSLDAKLAQAVYFSHNSATSAKALAEAAALLVLSKKAQAIWGTKEED